MECIDCVETVARLHLYIDRELSGEELVVVQQHLDSCPHCECRFHVDMSIKRLIHERCALERAPEHLRERVLQLAKQSKHEQVTFDSEMVLEIQADLEDYE